MEKVHRVHICLFIFPAIILAINQVDIIEETLPDYANRQGADMIPFYRNVIELTGKHFIRFTVKTGNDATLLFSERLATSISYNADFEYVQVLLGGWGNAWSNIRLGTMIGEPGRVSTPNILDNFMYKQFWISWADNIMKVGHGLSIGGDIIMQKAYPSTTDIKYLALWNGWGSGGRWKLLIGIKYKMH